MIHNVYNIVSKLMVVCAMVFVGSIAVFAQGVDMTAGVNKTQVRLGERLIYTITLTGDTSNLSDPTLPEFNQEFMTESVSTSVSFSWVNGQVSNKKIISYVLRPLKEGALTITPTTLDYKGDTLETNPISITVRSATQGTASPVGATHMVQAPASAQSLGNIFVTANVNKKLVYVGEQFVYKLHLYRRIQLWSNVSFSTPDFSGMFGEDLDKGEDYYLENVGNQRFYRFDLIKKSLFPLQPGSYTIPRSQVSFIVNPFDGKQRLSSAPLTVEVLPLPTLNKPADFSGLVGDYALTATFNAAEIVQNVPLTLKVTLAGVGNIKSVEALTTKKSDDFKILNASVKDSLRLLDQIEGERQFEYVVIPLKSGNLSMPVFTTSYFSPSEHRYKTLKSIPFKLSVKSNPNVRAVPEIGVKKGLEHTSDFAYLKSVNQINGYGSATGKWGLGVLLIFCLGLWGLVVKRPALSLVHHWFPGTSLTKQIADSISFFQSLYARQLIDKKILTEALTRYLTVVSGVIGQNIQGLTTKEKKQVFVNATLSELLQEQLISTIENIEFATFSPVTPTHDQGVRLIKALESTLRLLKTETQL